MTVSTPSELLHFIESSVIGGWLRRSSSGRTDSPTDQTKSEPPVSEPEFGWDTLTGEEQDRITDFAYRGIGHIEDVSPLLRRLPLSMSLEFRRGNQRAIEQHKSEMEHYRLMLRERAAEARRDKCTRQPASS